MKKSIFMMAAASLLMTACSSEETLDVNNGRAIQFRHGMTRASETTTGNLGAFVASAQTVDGKDYFEDVEFTKPEDAQTFSSAAEYYWPGDDSELNFSAYAPVSLKTQVTQNATTKKLTGFVPATDVAAQVDFITGAGSGKRSVNEGSGTELTFGHNLAQIEVKALSKNPLYTFEITGVKIANAVSKGDFDFASGWTLGSDIESYEILYANNATVTLGEEAESLMGGKGNAMLIPQSFDENLWVPDETAGTHNDNSGAYLAVKLKITRANESAVVVFPFKEMQNGKEEVSEWAAIPLKGGWEAGKKYTYILDFTSGAGYVVPEGPVDPDKPILGGPIKFTVNVEEWGEPTVVEQGMKVPAEEQTLAEEETTEGE